PGPLSASLRSAWNCSAGVGGLSWPPPAATIDKLAIRTRVPLKTLCTAPLRSPSGPTTEYADPQRSVTTLRSLPATVCRNNDGRTPRPACSATLAAQGESRRMYAVALPFSITRCRPSGAKRTPLPPDPPVGPGNCHSWSFFPDESHTKTKLPHVATSWLPSG